MPRIDYAPLNARFQAECPARVRQLIGFATTDLYHGPTMPFEESRADHEGWRDSMREILAENAKELRGAALLAANRKVLRVSRGLQEMPEGWDIPLEPVRYPGFHRAVREIRDWWSDSPLNRDMIYDLQSGEWLTAKPEGFWDETADGEPYYVDPSWEDFFEVEASEIGKELFGRELAYHVN